MTDNMLQNQMPDMKSGRGSLAGLRILEVESIGPGPFAGMILADHGASVLQISRPGPSTRSPNPVLYRNRAGTLTLDLKSDRGRKALLSLVEQADGLIEGFRPGVMERRGLGPAECLQRNAKLIYGRVTGWGREGRLAESAGHDINYISLSGALHAFGTEASGPIPPLNLVGDFGGGGLMLAFGMMAALREVQASGRGQVVDCAMVDGAALQMAMIYGMRAAGRWPADRSGNLLDGSAWFYTTYTCADGKWVAVGAIEPAFRQLLIDKLGLNHIRSWLMAVADQDAEARRAVANVFITRTRDEWQQIFDGTDACVTAVLSMDEAASHDQISARSTLLPIPGGWQPAPAPRMSLTPAAYPENLREERLRMWRLPAD